MRKLLLISKRDYGVNLIKSFKKDLFLWLSLFYIVYLSTLGAWWMYSFFKVQEFLPAEKSSKMMTMIKWEGATFLVILILLSISLLILYIRDQKKNKGIQAFYAGMTHELKTPLASMRLQAEVLDEISQSQNIDAANIQKYSSRLIEDSKKLEDQMDKILQLGRIEGGGNLNLENIQINNFIKDVHQKWTPQIELNFDNSKEYFVLADQYALELILRNLFENTLTHSKKNIATIKLNPENDFLNISYEDDGEFTGNKEKVGRLFYKHNSSKGSGIGLYLCRKLSSLMGGELKIANNSKWNLTFNLKLVGQNGAT